MLTFRLLKLISCVVFAVAINNVQIGFADIEAIQDLQKQRVKVCKALESQDDKKLIKALRETSDFLQKEVRKSVDPELMSRVFSSANRKLDLVYQADKIRKPQINYVGDAYRAAVAGLRVKYRGEINRQIKDENNLKADFYENDCKRLKK